MKEHSEYHIKYLGIEYIIQIYTIEDICYVESKTKERKEIRSPPVHQRMAGNDKQKQTQVRHPN